MEKEKAERLYQPYEQDKEKEEGTMATITKPYVYEYGRQKPDVKEPCISKEQMQQIKEAARKYLSGKNNGSDTRDHE